MTEALHPLSREVPGADGLCRCIGRAHFDAMEDGLDPFEARGDLETWMVKHSIQPRLPSPRNLDI